ncbi:YlcI/YnfO family protein [Mycetohabitans rhizoxinica]|uniref:YlcI/YnfO family protein n=1 Tax=Mycetohabitans rhizoxinica TaxID=412963 RepID=UPI003BAEB829
MQPKCNCQRHEGTMMKTATLPALRVEPTLRHAVEDVLNENETLSAFMESALRAGVTHCVPFRLRAARLKGKIRSCAN